jgi:hypothetical protein
LNHPDHVGAGRVRKLEPRLELRIDRQRSNTKSGATRRR